LPGPFA